MTPFGYLRSDDKTYLFMLAALLNLLQTCQMDLQFYRIAPGEMMLQPIGHPHGTHQRRVASLLGSVSGITQKVCRNTSSTLHGVAIRKLHPKVIRNTTVRNIAKIAHLQFEAQCTTLLSVGVPDRAPPNESSFRLGRAALTPVGPAVPALRMAGLCDAHPLVALGCLARKDLCALCRTHLRPNFVRCVAK
jgi:hypothetical protein